MNTLITFVLNHRRTVLAVWALCLVAAAPLSLRLPSVVQGGSEAIRGSESDRVTRTIQREFGKGAAYATLVVVQSAHTSVHDAGFRAAVGELEALLSTKERVRAVTHVWNSGAQELVGRDGKSALLLVQPEVDSLSEAERFTATLRQRLAQAPLPAGFSVKVTGPAATFHDINQNASADLLRAEMIGVPLTLLVLLAVFGSPLAAGLALVLAFAAVTVSAAVLYLLSPWLPVTVFARNAITIIGLGAGVDYCLFVLYRYRSALQQGTIASEALLGACRAAGPAVVVAGLAVGSGFLALFLVNARGLHSLAVGGLLVTVAAVAAAVTLLPVLLHYVGNRINWRIGRTAGASVSRALGGWGEALARRVIRRPWRYLVPCVALVAALSAPALRMHSWSVGVTDLPASFESREGFESLDRNFSAGWVGPVVLLLESRERNGLWRARAREAALAIGARLKADARVAEVHGFSEALERMGGAARERSALPGVVNSQGTVAVLTVIPRHPPESAQATQLVRELRARQWTEAAAAGFTVSVGGTTASVQDFDAAMLDGLWRVIPTVLAVTFAALLVFFRAVLIPLKAVVMNLLSVLAAYGFLVLVFQDGDAGQAAGSTPGLNSFVVLMLFTILFGLSMDYEIVLMRQIQEHYWRTGDNAAAVEAGLGRSAGVITSAAAIMICLFGSLYFTQLAATRQFGVGLAFAVAFDATVVRLIMVPALMQLCGNLNWWWPRLPGSGGAARARVQTAASPWTRG